MHNKKWHVASFVLVIVGGLNWGLIGLFNFNLVNLILGFSPTLERVVYVLVGVAAIFLVATHKKDCKHCSEAASRDLSTGLK